MRSNASTSVYSGCGRTSTSCAARALAAGDRRGAPCAPTHPRACTAGAVERPPVAQRGRSPPRAPRSVRQDETRSSCPPARYRRDPAFDAAAPDTPGPAAVGVPRPPAVRASPREPAAPRPHASSRRTASPRTHVPRRAAHRERARSESRLECRRVRDVAARRRAVP